VDQLFFSFLPVKGKVHPRRGYDEGTEEEYSFFILGGRWRWVVNASPRPLYPGEKDPVPIV
jgi:hypothetical protein